MTLNQSSACHSIIIVAALAFGAARAQPLPSDAKPTCVVSPAVFATWFETGTPTANGVVNPANSVTFPNQPNCSFYHWSEQMFLWLNSPAPTTYGGGARIFDSAVFFDVSPVDAQGARQFLPHSAGFVHTFPVRVAQAGPHGQPVVLSRAGQLLEIQARPTAAISAPAPAATIRTRTGATVAIARAELDSNQRVRLFNSAGALINHVPAPIPVGPALRQVQSVTKISINNIPIFINPQGQIVDVEQGQADDGVLEAQNGSLIYYATMVNDVYAYFTTGADDGGITPKPTQFPTTQADLNKIVSFAQAHGKTFPDPNALAIEVKSSWVEASTLPSTANYITMTATIPTYDRSNSSTWKPNGQKTALLAMVGMHVVGSAAGHPEMIWATFEHTNNDPAGTYTYNAVSGVKTVAQNTAGTWTFTANHAGAPFNAENMQASNGDIVAIPPHTISPSNVLRAKAWGAASNVSPNPLENTTASNTEIISINNSVLGKLVAGDIRSNYFMTGATWTIGGAAPSGSNQVGTSELGNSTMETFQQGTDSTTASGSVNCFSCHGTNTTAVSHVFGALKPLF